MCIKVLDDNGVILEKDKLQFVSGFYNNSVFLVVGSKPGLRRLMHKLATDELVTLLNEQHKIIRRQAMQLSCYEKFDVRACLEVDLTFDQKNDNN